MNLSNPTALRLGAQGMLNGRRHTVRGRVVLSVEIDHETYVWNEFNLVDEGGEALTLVHEEEEQGGVWRLFRYYELNPPITVAEAAGKRVGDTMQFEGRSIKVTLVDQSTVRYIEGEAPEGVEVGDKADYFNADAGDRTVVVSWTGGEVEYYEGRTLAPGRVEQAFNLPKPTEDSTASFNSGWSDGSGNAGGDGNSGARFAVSVLAALAFFGWVTFLNSGGGTYVPPFRPEPPRKIAAPIQQLPLASVGRIDGRQYKVAAHAVVEVNLVGRRFEQHEYDLRAEDGEKRLLVDHPAGSADDWLLLRPTDAPAPWTPVQAAALRKDSLPKPGGRVVQVRELFQIRVLSADGAVDTAAWAEKTQYGFSGTVANEWLVARWSERGITIYSGRPVDLRNLVRDFH
jgi:hypothetical protein